MDEENQTSGRVNEAHRMMSMLRGLEQWVGIYGTAQHVGEVPHQPQHYWCVEDGDVEGGPEGRCEFNWQGCRRWDV